MTKFLDGPAKDVSLSLRRAPLFLRVTRNTKGVWDALDQLADGPEPGETVYAYQLISKPISFHLCVRGKNRAAGGWYQAGEYKFVSDQPTETEMMDTSAWRAWCELNHLAVIHQIRAKTTKQEAQ